MEVGDKVISIRVKMNTFDSVKEVKMEEEEVLGVNDKHFVTNSYAFPTYQLKKDGRVNIHSVLNEVSVSDYTRDSKVMRDIFGNFSISMITDLPKKRAETRINKEFNKFLENKLGVYGFGTKVKISLGDINE